MFYYAKIDSNKIEGFYLESFHGKELCESLPHIKIDEELHGYLINAGAMRLNATIEKRVYTIEDKGLFLKEELEPIILPPSTEDRLAALETLMMGAI